MFTKAAIAFAAISLRPEALQETISEGPPTLETGIDVLPRQRPFLRDFATLGDELRPGVTDLRATLPVLNDAIEVGTPVLRRLAADQPQARGRRCASSNRLVAQPTTGVDAAAPQGDVRRGRAAGQVGRPGADRLQLLELLVHLPAERRSPTATRSATRSARSLTSSSRPRRRRRRAESTGYSACSRTAARRPALGRHLQAVRAADPQRPRLRARRASSDADCQGGQSGYALGQGLVPARRRATRPTASPTCPGRRGPTTLFYNDDGQPRARDTRIHSRQPETWGDRPMRRERDASACRAGLIGLVLVIVIAIASLPRVHQAAAVARRLRGQGRVRLGPEPAAELPVRIAGVNVGKVTEVEPLTAADAERRRRRRPAASAAGGGRGSRRPAGRRGDDGAQRRRAAAPRGRDVQAAPAPVPGGQLLRRPAARAARTPPRSTTATRSRSTRPRTRSSSTRC